MSGSIDRFFERFEENYIKRVLDQHPSLNVETRTLPHGFGYSRNYLFSDAEAGTSFPHGSSGDPVPVAAVTITPGTTSRYLLDVVFRFGSPEHLDAFWELDTGHYRKGAHVNKKPGPLWGAGEVAFNAERRGLQFPLVKYMDRWYDTLKKV